MSRSWNNLWNQETGVVKKSSLKKQRDRQKKEWAKFHKKHRLVESNGYKKQKARNQMIGEN